MDTKLACHFYNTSLRVSCGVSGDSFVSKCKEKHNSDYIKDDLNIEEIKKNWFSEVHQVKYCPTIYKMWKSVIVDLFSAGYTKSIIRGAKEVNNTGATFYFKKCGEGPTSCTSHTRENHNVVCVANITDQDKDINYENYSEAYHLIHSLNGYKLYNIT